MENSVNRLLLLTLRSLSRILGRLFHHHREVLLPVGREMLQSETSLEFDSADMCAAFLPQRITILEHRLNIVGDHVMTAQPTPGGDMRASSQNHQPRRDIVAVQPKTQLQISDRLGGFLKQARIS